MVAVTDSPIFILSSKNKMSTHYVVKIKYKSFITISPHFSSRKRRGSETLSEEGSSGDESYRLSSSRRGGGGSWARRRREEGRSTERRRGEEVRCLQQHGEAGEAPPVMSECTAAMVLMDLSGSPAGRVSHASGQSGQDHYLMPSLSSSRCILYITNVIIIIIIY